jgi:hypothetical protein
MPESSPDPRQALLQFTGVLAGKTSGISSPGGRRTVIGDDIFEAAIIMGVLESKNQVSPY